MATATGCSSDGSADPGGVDAATDGDEPGDGDGDGDNGDEAGDGDDGDDDGRAEEAPSTPTPVQDPVDAGTPLVWMDGGIGDVADDAVTCDNSQIELTFSPMYSAYDGVHLFQIPATIENIDPEAITWGLEDPSIASLQVVPNGVMLTIQAPGTTKVIASAGSICGISELTVTEFDPQQWEIGSARYNNGLVLETLNAELVSSGEASEAACTSCHGKSATNGMFQTVAHTPAQTGGFSDEELIGIVTEADLPEGAYFDEGIIPMAIWKMFHKWKMEGEQRDAIIVYLRSLTPNAQTGQSPLTGLPVDGGMGDAP
jgi:hypothetical protein